MTTIKSITEPWDAAQVSKTLNASLCAMKQALEALEAQQDGHGVVSSPVKGHVFFVDNYQLLCLPSEMCHNGLIDESAEAHACSLMEMDLSVTVQRSLIEAIDEWVSRPVYSLSRVSSIIA